jgi:hypothetical protein
MATTTTKTDAISPGALAEPLEMRAPASPLRDLAAGDRRLVRMMHYLEFIVGRFNTVGVDVMALKGAALHLTLYRQPRDRPMVDLDLLVRPADARRALTILEETGCLRRHTPMREDFFPRYYYEIEYTAGTLDPIEIDLHVRPFRLLRYARVVPDEALWARAERLRLGSAELLVPSPEDMLIHLATHCAIHACGEQKWLEDLRRWVETHGRCIDWDRLLADTRAWRLGLPVRRGLQAAEARLGPFLPDDVRECLGVMPANWRDRLALWHAPRDRANLTKSFLVSLATTPGLRFKLGYLRTILAPGREYMDEWCTRHGSADKWARVRRCLAPLTERLPGRSRLEVGRSRIHGQGIRATRDIKPGTIIARYRGRPTNRRGTYTCHQTDAQGRETCHEITGPLRFLNHCCRPNARLDNFRLVALRPIRRGQEITISYGHDACDCEAARIDANDKERGDQDGS